MVYGITMINASRKIITPMAAPADTRCCWNVVIHMLSANTSVDMPGPPKVTIYTMSKTFNVLMSSNETSTSRPERMLGIITEIRMRIFDAPSTVADSTISCSSDVRKEDWIMMTAKPRYCQMKIRISQYVAVSGFVTYFRGESIPRLAKIVLNTPFVGLYIHDQIVPVTMNDIATG